MEGADSYTGVCQHNQSGYCKHGMLCFKRHENKICPKNKKCEDKVCEMRHPKRCKFFDMNNKCRFENCAYSHSKDENVEKVDQLETKCSALEAEIKYTKEVQEKINPQIDLMGKGIMKLKKKVEGLASMCNGMNSTTEILRNENTIFEESKSPDLTEEKEKIPSEYKTLKKKKIKEKKNSED